MGNSVNQTSTVANIISSLYFRRSELGTIAFEQLSNSSKILFGTGMRIQANIRDVFCRLSGSYGLDGEPQWFVFTTGVVGALITLFIVTLAMYYMWPKNRFDRVFVHGLFW